jgi:SAM-dependent methyltransferase
MIADAVQAALRTEEPLIVDLGIGPGSLTRHLLERIPGAQVVGIDADPLLLALSGSGVGSRFRKADGSSRLRVVDADLRDPAWLDAAGLDRAPDAYVSTTALHWLRAAELRALIRTCGTAIAPGGCFVDGDHIYLEDKQAPWDAFTIELGQVQSRRKGVHERETWEDWWAAVEADPRFDELIRAREGRLQDRGGEPGRLHDYVESLHEAGFGDDRVVAGIGHPGS